MVVTRSQRARQPSTDRQKWEIILTGLRQLLRKQQAQLDSLFEDREFLQQRLKIQQNGWNSDLTLLQDHISQLRRQLELSKLANLVEITKGELLVGSQERNTFAYKSRLEHARNELDDFKACFDILSHKCPDNEAISLEWLYEVLNAKGSQDRSSKQASEQDYKMLEKEFAKLKREYDKLSLKNSSEVSALRAEIKFVWNQYNEMEGNYTKQLQEKNLEVKEANEKIMKLLARLEQVQLLNSEKDQIVVTLRTKINRLEADACQKEEKISKFSKEPELKSKSNVGFPTLKRCSGEPSSSGSKQSRNNTNNESADLEKESSAELEATVATLSAKINKLEAEASHKNGEISTLLKELNLLRSKTVANTPVLGRCTNEPSSSRLRGQTNGSTRGTMVPKEEGSPEKGLRRSKRKQENVINIEDTPRLFTSQFKIPKLKSQSPRGR